MTRSGVRRWFIGGAGAAVLVVAGALPAAAHVTVSPDTTDAGAYALLTFAVPHGCDGSPTTKVTINLPDEGIGPVTPSVNPNWDVERVREGDDPQGNVLQVVYTAKTPLPDDLRDTFELSTLILPDAEGETIAFPILQTCEEGETNWDQIPEDGQDPHDLDEPAPAFTVTAAEAPAHDEAEDGAASDEASSEEAGAVEQPAADESPTRPAASEASAEKTVDPLSVAGLVLGALGVVLGGAALIRTRSAHRSN